MASNAKPARDRFILKVAVLHLEGKNDIAEELIREARALGLRKPGWLKAISVFIDNRNKFPRSQEWAIRGWILSANAVNGSTVNARINGTGDARPSQGEKHGRTDPEGDGEAREVGSSGGLYGRL